jgi:hypothetical protein
VILQLLTIAKVKLFFAVVNPLRLAQARFRLWQYERTLSPQNRAFAVQLRLQLAADKKNAAAILVREARRLQEQQMRLVERMDRLERS